MEKLEEMTARRELDAKVAEKVMGWKDVRMGRDDIGGEPFEVYDFEGNKAIWQIVPQYSTDIAAAWLVVEELTQSGKWTCEIYRDDAEFQVVFETVADEPFPFVAYADTAPHAICLASLEAVKARKELSK